MKFFIISSLCIVIPVLAYAQNPVQLPSWSSTAVPSVSQNLLDTLPTPLSNFVRSMVSAGQGITLGASKINVSSINPIHAYESVDNWLQSKFGVNLSSILKTIGNIIVWVLLFTVNIVKSILSWIK